MFVMASLTAYDSHPIIFEILWGPYPDGYGEGVTLIQSGHLIVNNHLTRLLQDQIYKVSKWT